MGEDKKKYVRREKGKPCKTKTLINWRVNKACGKAVIRITF
jgi:hypothetical protein